MFCHIVDKVKIYMCRNKFAAVTMICNRLTVQHTSSQWLVIHDTLNHLLLRPFFYIQELVQVVQTILLPLPSTPVMKVFLSPRILTS